MCVELPVYQLKFLPAGFFFGHTSLIKLSPNKTWEGFLGGFASTVVFGFIVSASIRLLNQHDPSRLLPSLPLSPPLPPPLFPPPSSPVSSLSPPLQFAYLLASFDFFLCVS